MNMYYLKNKQSFTLLEVIVSSTIISIILVVVLSIYFMMIKTKYDIEARQSLLQNSYMIVERINVLLKDYTIDYEEYFNRRIVGCNSNNGGDSFAWNVGDNGKCDRFTHYGNSKLLSPSSNIGNGGVYYCSSVGGGDSYLINGNNGCRENAGLNTQGYGSYKRQFWNMKGDMNSDGRNYFDDDDYDNGIGPVSIGDNNNVKELYLISRDGKNRVYIRRNLIGTQDFDNNGTVDKDYEKYYNLEILKLKGFDAGIDHDFNSLTKEGMYDGNIDTWACDYSEGFICNGDSLNGAYSNYRLPRDGNDGRVTIFGKDLTIVDWKMELFPTQNGSLAWQDTNYQINPYFKIYLKTKLYGESWIWKVHPNILDEYEFNVQTTFNIKSFY